METLITKLTMWLGAILPAVLGSALALFFNRAAQLSRAEIACNFVFGAYIGYLLGGAAIEYWVINPLSFIAFAIMFSIGLMGMATLAQVMLNIPKTVELVRKKWLGE